jgi:hypothetical protein
MGGRTWPSKKTAQYFAKELNDIKQRKGVAVAQIQAIKRSRAGLEEKRRRFLPNAIALSTNQ